MQGYCFYLLAIARGSTGRDTMEVLPATIGKAILIRLRETQVNLSYKIGEMTFPNA